MAHATERTATLRRPPGAGSAKNALRLKKALAGFGLPAYKAPPDANDADAVHEDGRQRRDGEPDKPAASARTSQGRTRDGSRFDRRRDV
ncbi:hypothetical protein [Azospirillum doebereinerae]